VQGINFKAGSKHEFVQQKKLQRKNVVRKHGSVTGSVKLRVMAKTFRSQLILRDEA
jgi:hypothetical protein